jgi:hypothetical protein
LFPFEDRITAVSSDFASRHTDSFLSTGKIVSHTDYDRLDLAIRVHYQCQDGAYFLAVRVVDRIADCRARLCARDCRRRERDFKILGRRRKPLFDGHSVIGVERCPRRRELLQRVVDMQIVMDLLQI